MLKNGHAVNEGVFHVEHFGLACAVTQRNKGNMKNMIGLSGIVLNSAPVDGGGAAKVAKEQKGAVTVQTSKEVAAEEKQKGHIRKLGEEIVKLTVKAGEKYFDLCSYIRKEQVAPKLVSAELKELGFHKVRISEINKVAQCSDELWNQFAARTLGFKGVLSLERGTVQNMVAEVQELPKGQVEEGLSELAADELGANAGGASPASGGSDLSEEQKLQNRITLGAKSIYSAALKLNELGLKPKATTFKFPGLTVTIKIAKGGVKSQAKKADKEEEGEE